MRMAIECFEQAIARDSNFPAAHAGLAGCMGSLGWWGYAPTAVSCARAKELALRAIDMNPGLAEAHAALAWAVQYYDYAFVIAEREFRRAVELDPHYPVAHHQLAMTLVMWVDLRRRSRRENRPLPSIRLPPSAALPSRTFIG
jgi:serine/threonine-protein kinase